MAKTYGTWVLLAGVAMTALGCGYDDSAGGGFGSGSSGSNDGFDSEFDDRGARAPVAGGAAGASGGSSTPVGAASGGSGGAQGGAPAEPGGTFQAVGTNPFVMVGHDPFSTFGADVDTASYDLFRRYVDSGALPPPASVRLEEYVNSFSYAYPAPALDAPTPFSISLAAAPHVLAAGTLLVRVGIQGKNPPPFVKKPANLVFLVDVSGSMQAPDKLPLVKKLLVETLEVLAPTDRVSLVTYAGNVGVRLPSTPVSNRNAIVSAINGLESGGSTNGAGGLQLAYQQATANFIAGGINHIVLCTDGDFNVGISSTAELKRFIEEKRKTGVTFTGVGFGIDNLNDGIMETISNAGNGIYAHVGSEEAAVRYAHDKMLATLVHIAKDMKIQVEWNPATVLAYRLLGYENRDIADADFRNDVVDGGEIGAGHRVTALYEVVPAGGRVPVVAGAPEPKTGAPSDLPREIAGTDMVLVKVRYKQPGATETDPAQEVSATLGTQDVYEGLGDADDDLKWAAGVAAFAEIVKKSPYAAAAKLDAITGLVTPQAQRDADRATFVRLFQRARAMVR